VPPLFPFADLALARRLELTEGRGNAAFVDAQARFDPASGAIWKAVGGTFAMFAGVGSPITQTFGLGLHEPLVEKDLDTIERFFTARASAVFHEVCPLAGVEVVATLAKRGYRPIELSTVLYQPIDANTRIASDPSLTLRVAGAGEGLERASRSDAVRGGFCEAEPGLRHVLHRGQGWHADRHGGAVHARGHGAARGGEHGARGAAARRPERAARHPAAHRGITGSSASQRNAERNGFRVAYTRTKWQL
jgi:hypothetical protein